MAGCHALSKWPLLGWVEVTRSKKLRALESSIAYLFPQWANWVYFDDYQFHKSAHWKVLFYKVTNKNNMIIQLQRCNFSQRQKGQEKNAHDAIDDESIA